MAPNTLVPASIIIKYHSQWAPHTMTIPTKDWIPTPVSGDLGSYLAWDGSTVDGEVMVNALVNVLKPFCQPGTSFDEATVYTKASVAAPNIPRKSVALTQVGTSSSTQPAKGIAYTFHFRTLAYGISKLMLLDVPIGSNWFAPILPAGFDAVALALEAAFINQAAAWAGRDDTRPELMNKITVDLNDKLQRQYWGT
jgi:hypothetical protein